MIAACHLWGALPLSRMIAAVRATSAALHMMALSLSDIFLFSPRGICDTCHKRFLQKEPCQSPQLLFQGLALQTWVSEYNHTEHSPSAAGTPVRVPCLGAIVLSVDVAGGIVGLAFPRSAKAQTWGTRARNGAPPQIWATPPNVLSVAGFSLFSATDVAKLVG